jgi:hypothetical protein
MRSRIDLAAAVGPASVSVVFAASFHERLEYAAVLDSLKS